MTLRRQDTEGDRTRTQTRQDSEAGLRRGRTQIRLYSQAGLRWQYSDETGLLGDGTLRRQDSETGL